MGDTENQQKRKNKKRKSVLSNAKKYGKKGRYGRGSEINEDTYQYFVRVLETYKEGFPNDEEKGMFANNVLGTTENEEVNYSCNQLGCRIIEMLLPFASNENLTRFINAFSENLRQYLGDRFASHVIQALLRICYEKYLKENNEECKKFTLKISKFLLNNLEDYINDTYGNHIIREVFQTFAGIKEEKKEEIKSEDNINEEFIEIIQEYTKRLILWPHFKDLPFNELSSGLLQILLVSLKKVDLKLFKKVVKKLIDESFSVSTDEDTLKDVFKSKPAIALLESAINVATPKLYNQIYANCFIQTLPSLAKNKDTNFAVQKLLNACTEKTEFESMFEELSEHFEPIISCGYTGVILALAQSCKRLLAKQGPFVQCLMKALNCIEPQERQNHFSQTVIRLIPFERVDAAQKEKYFVNLHGSLLIQAMLEFNKPIKIVNSILNMDANDIKILFCDPKGSHIANAYMSSQFIGEKNREKLTWRMQGTYQELASSKHGSRSLEAIWNAANLKLRTKIMDELSHKEGLWRNTQTGIIIASKFNLDLYKRNVDQWKQTLTKVDKTKELFAEIVGDNL